MLKIPTFIIGGLLILTGLVGFLLQDLGLSLKLTGPLADDAEFTLSDGNDSVTVDLGFPSSKSAGEYAFWMVHQLNLKHAKDRSQANYAVEHGSTAYETKSFWHASSKGNTQDILVKHADTGEMGDLANTDTNRSTIRFFYKNFTNNTGPVTLTSTNWANVKSNPELKPGDSLEFDKSWTAFIPGIIGIILILLAQGAESAPKARKHIMHVAVLIGLVGFIAVAKQLPKAISEMNWLKSETYGIIQASTLKSTTMLASAGLLLVFVILCIVSFITARKEMAAKAKAEAEKKKKVLNKVKAKNEDANDNNSDKDGDNEKKSDSNSKDSTSEKTEKKDESSKSADKKSSHTDKDQKKEDKTKTEVKKKETLPSDKAGNSKPEDTQKPSTENQKIETTSKSKEPPKAEPKKEPLNPQSDYTEPKKEVKTSAVRKPTRSSDDLNKSKNEGPSKESPSSKDSGSSSESNSKDLKDSKEEKAQTNSDIEKSDKEETTKDSLPKV
jgi:uncharacterized membrane protein